MQRTIVCLVLSAILALSAACTATPTVAPTPTSQPTVAVEVETITVATLAPTTAASATVAASLVPSATPETQAAPTEAATTEPTPAATVAPSATSAPEQVAWTPDGIVSADEYTSEATIGSVKLWWRHDGEHLFMAMQADTQGWVSVGFMPQQRMQGADYVLGFVRNGQAEAHDAWGDAPVGSHPEDVELGGTNDLVAFGGAEDANGTTIEFQRPLAPTDKYDKVLEPGSVALIVATGARDGFTTPHNYRGSGSITLE